jgi:hypothetical protein
MFHVKLGAAQNEQTFEDLEQLHANDNAFKRFHIKLADFLSDSLPVHGIPLPNVKRIKFTPNETVCCSIFLLHVSSNRMKVTEHQFLKVNFESIIDWRITTDYLQCSPSFHNFARYMLTFCSFNSQSLSLSHTHHLRIQLSILISQSYSPSLLPKPAPRLSLLLTRQRTGDEKSNIGPATQDHQGARQIL